MTVGGIPEFLPTHAEKMCYVALGMLWEARAIHDPITKKSIEVRIGIHSGTITAGIVGGNAPRLFKK